jgi:hypothetical protein
MKLLKVPVSNLIGDTQNPRKPPPVLYELLDLSLRKLGLLSPVYATPSGLLLSGHQRTTTLKKYGYQHVYVSPVKLVEDTSDSRTAINFSFNKVLQCFNYEESEVGPEDLANTAKYLRSLPDLPNFLSPLEEIQTLPVEYFSKEPLDHVDECAASRILHKKARVIVPLVLNAEGKVVNSLTRLKYYTRALNQIPCVFSEHATQDIFSHITAAYKMEGASLDNVRVSQRRHFVTPTLPYVYTLIVPKKLHAKGAFLNKFLKSTYPRMLDFGSGNAQQSVCLRKEGYDLTLFEPFAVGDKFRFSLSLTYEGLSKFLDSIELNPFFHAIVSNAVLNSVPTAEDTGKVLKLLKFVGHGSKIMCVSSRNLKSFDRDRSRGVTTTLPGQGTTKVSSAKKVKVQNFYNEDHLKEFFDGRGVTTTRGPYSAIVIKNPEYFIPKDELLEAVAFEFGLNYQGRVFEDIKARALEVFSKAWHVKYDN